MSYLIIYLFLNIYTIFAKSKYKFRFLSFILLIDSNAFGAYCRLLCSELRIIGTVQERSMLSYYYIEFFKHCFFFLFSPINFITNIKHKMYILLCK